MEAKPGTDLAVVESDRDAQLELDAAADPFDDPQQLLVRVLCPTPVHGETVQHPGFAAAGAKDGLGYKRFVDVGVRRFRVRLRGVFFAISAALRILHSFPTRRSSD